MKPTKRKIDYEKVAIGEFIIGEISNIQYDLEHRFKGFGDREDTVTEAVRFVFDLEGYQFKHYSRWLKFTYGEKSTLYKKYLVKLVEGAHPDMDFDLDALKGMRVKTLWKEENGFQEIEAIFPIGKKLPLDAPVIESEETPAIDKETPENEEPF